MIAEIATVTRKDGTASRFGREKGRKLFALLTPAGTPDPQGTGYSRRRLEERPQMDRGVAAVGFEKVRQIAKVDGGAQRSATGAFFDEVCDRCDESVAAHTGSYWRAPDDLWEAVVGDVVPPPILCPPCFTALAKERGISVAWEARPTLNGKSSEEAA